MRRDIGKTKSPLLIDCMLHNILKAISVCYGDWSALVYEVLIRGQRVSQTEQKMN